MTDRQPDPTPSAPQPVAPASQLARWLEMTEFCIEATERERVDILCDLAESLETAWLVACDAEQAA